MPKSQEIKGSKNIFRPSNQKLIIKEEDGEFYSEGFVATTHPDRAYDSELGVDGDILSKEAIMQIVDFINSGSASTDDVGSPLMVSKQHDWVKANDASLEPAGIVIPPAVFKETGDGHYGAYVKVHHNKYHPDFAQIKDYVEQGYYPGYSIEFVPGNTEMVTLKDKAFRFVKDVKNYVGHAFASARLIANPMALIQGFGYKEIQDGVKNQNNLEVDRMDENKEEVQKSVEEKQEKVEEPVVEKPVEPEAKPVEPEAEKSEEPESKEVKVDVKEFVKQLKESGEFKALVSEQQIEKKTLNTGVGGTKMDVNIKEMNDGISKLSYKENDPVLADVKEFASRYIDEHDLITKALEDPANYTRGFKYNVKMRCVGKGMKIVGGLSVKGTLGTGDNTSPYTQADVELADVFAPGIIDTFNNQTNLFGFLRKEQHPGGSHYQWKMVTNKDPESNATFVDENDVSILKNYASKENYQTPLKIARRGISVTDFLNRYSARALGDLFQIEINLQMLELMNDVNAALFAEVADGTNTHPLGLEAVADATGNGTLYAKSRSTANRLSPATATDTYEAIGGDLTEAKLRAHITSLEIAGVRQGDIAIIANPRTRDFLFNLMDGVRRFNSIEASFGFNKKMVPLFDSYPMIVDSDCNTDAIYVIDQSSDVIVMAMEPRITQLAKISAATEAYIEMDFAHVYKEPRKISMLDTLSGP